MFLVVLNVGLAVSIDEPRLWQTTGESYDVWVSVLVHSLIEYTDSEILRY